MKKLLTLLGAMLLTATPVATTVSCSYNNGTKDIIKRQESFYSNVSGEALKTLILADQNFNISGKKGGLDLDYTKLNYSSQKAQDVFPEYIKDVKPENRPGIEVADFYKTVFGTAGGDNEGGANYSPSRDYGCFKNTIKKGTRLDRIINNNVTDDNLYKPDDGIAKTLNIASGALNIALGNDFSPSVAGMVSDFLKSDMVKDLLAGLSDDLLKTIYNVLDNYGSRVETILKALTQEELTDESLTYKDILQTATNKLFSGLTFFIKNKEVKDEKNGTEVFFNELLGIDNKDNVQPKGEDWALPVAQILFFANTFFHYISAFDNYKNQNIIDSNHLFDNTKSNGEIIAKVLSNKYKNNNEEWYKIDGVEYAIINLQNIASDLQLYLSPDDKNDPKGYNTLRFINILLGNSMSKTINGNYLVDFNPILKTIIESLEKSLKAKINNPGLESTINSAFDLFNNLIKKAITWLTTDGDYNSEVSGTLKDLINAASELTRKLKPLLNIIGNLAGENVKKIINTISNVIDYLSSPSNQKMLEHPWIEFYSGDLLGNIIKMVNNLANLNIDESKIQYVSNFKSLLTNNLSDIISIFPSIKLPDWLYNLRTTSLSDVFNKIAEIFETNRYSTIDENNNYFMNTQDIKDLVLTLFKHEKYSYVKKDGNDVSVIEALITAVKGEKTNSKWTVNVKGKEVNIIDSNGNWQNNAIDLIFGVTKGQNTNTFNEGSLLYKLSRIYGHNYEKSENGNKNFEPDYNHDIKKMAKSASKLFGVFMEFSKFAQDSIKQLFKDDYSKYFDPKRFRISNVSSYGLDKDLGKDEGYQKLWYNIEYYNVDESKWYNYEVELSRQSFDQAPDTDLGWWLSKFTRTN